jgi:hypothetical protein
VNRLYSTCASASLGVTCFVARLADALALEVSQQQTQLKRYKPGISVDPLLHVEELLVAAVSRRLSRLEGLSFQGSTKVAESMGKRTGVHKASGILESSQSRKYSDNVATAALYSLLGKPAPTPPPAAAAKPKKKKRKHQAEDILVGVNLGGFEEVSFLA